MWSSGFHCVTVQTRRQCWRLWYSCGRCSAGVDCSARWIIRRLQHSNISVTDDTKCHFTMVIVPYTSELQLKLFMCSSLMRSDANYLCNMQRTFVHPMTRIPRTFQNSLACSALSPLTIHISCYYQLADQLHLFEHCTTKALEHLTRHRMTANISQWQKRKLWMDEC